MIIVGQSAQKIKLMSKLALKYKLFTQAGILQSWYNNPLEIELILLYKFGNLFCGVAALSKNLHIAGNRKCVNFCIFVNPIFRRKGVGTELTNKMKTLTDKELLFYNVGYRKQFFERVL